MLNRRQIMQGASLAAGAALVAAGPARAAVKTSAPVPPKGPWTEFGEIQRGGGVLHWAALGPKDSAKPPVILTHKLGGWLSDWRFVAPLLASDRRVIAFDLPGHGGSRWAGKAPYVQTLGETAALLHGAFYELGFDQVDYIGTSLGGCAGVPLAAFWPERIRKLAIVSSALGGAKTMAELKAGVDDKQKGTLFDAKGRPVPTAPDLLRKTFGIVNAESIAKEGDQSRLAAGDWIQPSERGVGATDIKGTLSRVKVPTLLVYGQFDKAYLKFREGAEAALTDHVTKIVPNAGAFVMQDNPKDTAAILNEWIAG